MGSSLLDPSLPVAVLDAALWGVNDVGGVEDCSRGGVTVEKQNRADPGKTGGLSVASNEWVVMPWRTKENVTIHLADSYSDQARLASERRLKPTYFNREDLMKHIESKQVLSVE